MQRLIIKGRLPGMNEIIAAAKSHYGKYSAMKKENTEMIAWECKAQKLKPMKRVNIAVTWFCTDSKRDQDNIAAGFKFIGDGLQMAGVLSNDGWKNINRTSHEYRIDKNERIEIEMEEAEQ